MSYTTINKPSDYFNTVLYTGNGSTQSIAVGFQPDWIWCKPRGNAGWHFLSDSVRGGTKVISSNSANAEITRSSNIQSFTSTGYTLGADGTSNSNGDATVSWNWKANGTGSANTDGSINSTVSANTTSGFSIVSYTGNGSQPSTVGHGLGVTPQVVLVKPRNDAQSWCMYHESIGNTKVTYLDSTSASASSVVWNNTSPTSSVFTVNDNQVNSNTITYIAYCFAEKQGYSKFGSYTGNGSTNGPFVYTGFKPSFVMLKLGNAAGENWTIFDTKRNNYSLAYTQDNFNVVNSKLYPNSSGAEEYENFIDILSNGFKIRTASAGGNGSTYKYTYMAFAEAPLVGSNNVPCTAR